MTNEEWRGGQNQFQPDNSTNSGILDVNVECSIINTNDSGERERLKRGREGRRWLFDLVMSRGTLWTREGRR